jgi:hypothetical protein
MNDELDLKELAQKGNSVAPFPRRVSREEEGDEESCLAYGYLRGLREQAITLEFRYRDGNTDAHSYSHLASFRFNPSVGVLLKFTSDVTTLVLIEGSNLDAMLPGRSVNLIDRGIARYRVTYVREMDEDELRRAGEADITIDQIKIEEFESQVAATEWLQKNAPVFVRESVGVPRRSQAGIKRSGTGDFLG